MKYTTQYLAIIIATLSVACNNNTKDAGPKITTGERVEVKTQTIASTGGEIKVDKPGDPLDQFSIKVPAGAYDDNRNYEISYTTIKDHDLGQYFHPLTPLITIKNGGGFANQLMTITIPVHVPDGHFAMAFLYNEKTGELEGLPLLASDKDKVVVATRTFDLDGGETAAMDADNSHPGETKLGQTANGQTTNANGSATLVVSSTAEKDLQKDFDSDFRPGVDDISIPNPASIYAPKGMCSGQSVAMMWYYTERRKKGAAVPLYKLLDNDGGRSTPRFWQDDIKAIKLTSVLQYAFNYTAPFHIIVDLGQLISQSILPNRMTMYALAYAMIQTHLPQFIAVVANNGNGHAMVAYRIKDNEVYIADPNLPGITTQRLKYDESTHDFGSYISGRLGNAPGEVLPTADVYTHIYYLARASLCAYSTVGSNWAEMDKGTIGSGKFPEYTIKALNTDNEFVPLTDGFNVPGGLFTISIHGGKFDYFLYDQSGKLLEILPNTAVQLPKGEQLVGIHIVDPGSNWVGFRWVNVKVGDEEVKATGPLTGLARFTYREDDVNFSIDTGIFRIERESFRISAPQYLSGTKSNISFSSEHWHGGGAYNDIVVSFNKVTKEGEVYSYTTGDNLGTMWITQWSGGRLDGTFNVTVSGIKGTINISGEFHFPFGEGN